MRTPPAYLEQQVDRLKEISPRLQRASTKQRIRQKWASRQRMERGGVGEDMAPLGKKASHE